MNNCELVVLVTLVIDGITLVVLPINAVCTGSALNPEFQMTLSGTTVVLPLVVLIEVLFTCRLKYGPPEIERLGATRAAEDDELGTILTSSNHVVKEPENAISLFVPSSIVCMLGRIWHLIGPMFMFTLVKAPSQKFL